MKKFLLAVLFVLAFVGVKAQTLDPNYIDGHLYFKFVDSYNFQFVVNENTSIDMDQMKAYKDLFDRYGVTLVTRPLYAFNDPFTERVIRLEFREYQKIDQFIRDLEALPEVEYAERVPLPKLLYNDPLSSGSWSTAVGAYQWNLTMINAEAAWALQVASSDIKVAVVDGAVWGAHPDLNIASANMCSFATGTASPGNSAPPTTVAQGTNCSYTNFYNGNCPSYDWSHGTHCAGMVAAKNHNGIGISSIGGGDGTTGSGLTLMGVRAANNNDQLYYCSNGVTWAANNGAKVISMSYGSSSSSSSESRSYQNLANNGIVLVAAAGNEGDEGNEISYPAGYSSVISVASVDKNGKLSYFSQYGAGRADIAAPGGFYNSNTMQNNILSTTYCANQYWRISGYSTLNGQYYDGMQGTSMACPTVAGLCGLMLSAYPNMTPAQVKSCLQSTATALASGSNPIDGNGYINASAAVSCAKSLAAALRAEPSVVTIPTSGGSATSVVTAATNIAGSWSATCTNNAFTVTPATGSGSGANTTITITKNTPNTTDEDITGTITITQGTGGNRQTTSIVVTQPSGTVAACGYEHMDVYEDPNWSYGSIAYSEYFTQYNYFSSVADKYHANSGGTIDSVYIGGALMTTGRQNSQYNGKYITLKVCDATGTSYEGGPAPGNVLSTQNINLTTLRSAWPTQSSGGTTYYVGDNYGIKLPSAVTINPGSDYFVVIDFTNVGDANMMAIADLDTDYCENTMMVYYTNGTLSNPWMSPSTLFSGVQNVTSTIMPHFCPSNEPFVVTDPEEIVTPPSMGVEDIEVTSNTSWTVSSSCDWVTISPTSGFSNGTVNIGTSENMNAEERTCTITFTYEGGSKTVEITQLPRQTGCEYAHMNGDYFGWRVNDAGDAYVCDRDSIYIRNYTLDKDNTIDSGFYHGGNYYGDQCKADFFAVYGTGSISSVDFLYDVTGTRGSVAFKIWDGSTGVPTTVLASKTATLSSLNGANYYTWELDEPLEVTGSVFVGVDMTNAQTSGSWFRFYSNIAGATTNTAWECYNGNWVSMEDSWGASWTMTIFPYICYNGSHPEIDLMTWFVDNATDQNEITTLTLNPGEALSPNYVVYNIGPSTYTDSVHVAVTADGTPLTTLSKAPAALAAGAGYIANDQVATFADLMAGHANGDVVDVCYTVSHINASNWDEADASDNTACLSVTLNCPPTTGSISQSACGSYTWAATGQTYTTGGDKVAHLTSANGCDSVLTLHLTINNATSGSETRTECDGYTWQGQTYTTSGTYTKTLVNAAGCDSTATLHLTIVSTPNVTVTPATATIYAGGNVTLTASGATSYSWSTGATSSTITVSPTVTTTYTVTGTNGSCSSTASAVVTVDAAPTTTADVYQTACGHYTWDKTGLDYTTTGNYSYTTTNHLGGDSIITLHLTINALPNISISGNNNIYVNQTTTLTATGANTYSWSNGQTGASINVTPTVAGTSTYTVTGTNTATGCQNTASYTVTATQYNSTATVNQTACGEYYWDKTNQTYTVSGDYTYTTRNYLGGDSVITLHLTIKTLPTVTISGTSPITVGGSSTLTATGASTYTWSNGQSGSTITVSPATSTTYTVTGVGSNGCENTANFTVVVNAPTTIYDTVRHTDCGSYTWNGATYTTSGTYQYAEGNNVHVLVLTINPLPTVSISGNTNIYIGQSTTLTATGANTYTWSTGATGSTLTVSPTSTTTYTVTGTSAAGCEGTASITVSATRYNNTGDVYQTACGSYTWPMNGITYNQGGNYQATTTNYLGGDSVVTLHLTINPLPTVSISGNTNIYIGQSTTLTATGASTYTWSTGATGATLTVSPTATTTYAVTGTNASGCEGTASITVYPQQAGTTYGTVFETACDSYFWELHNQTYYTSGTYQHTIPGANANGGDSVVTLFLTINNTTYLTDVQTACDSYTWHGNTYTTSNNTATYTTTGANGCPQVTTLNLTINNSTTADVTETACDTYTWAMNNSTYTESGDYTYNTTGANGCNLATTLHLTINQTSRASFTDEGCDLYEWHGMTYTQTGNYLSTSVNPAGCPHIDTLHLTIYPSTTETIDQMACESYTWDGTGMTYTESTTASYTTINEYGCDKVVTLNLTINHSVNGGESTETACDSYTWDASGNTYTYSGDYVESITGSNGCDSIITLHLTINYSNHTDVADTAVDSYTWAVTGETYTATGEYVFEGQTAEGCDSTITLHLTITTGGDEGIDDVNGVRLVIYPNPATTNVNIECANISTVRVYDMSGRVVEDVKDVANDNVRVNVSGLAEGSYVFAITTQSGAVVKQKVVIAH